MKQTILSLTNDVVIFHAQCQRLEVTLNMYQDLYEADDNQKTMMRRMAYHFFLDLSHILQNEFLVQVYKLTDPPASGRPSRDNLTFQRIQMDLASYGLLHDGTTRQELAACVDAVQLFRNNVAKEPRNRVCAHLDRETLRELSKLGPKESGPGAHEDHERETFFENMYRFIVIVEGLLNLDLGQFKDYGRLPGASAKEMFQWVESRLAKRP